MSIRVESIRKTFGAFTALEDINLDVARGGLVGLRRHGLLRGVWRSSKRCAVVISVG